MEKEIINLGRFRPVPEGVWDETRTYKRLSVVTHSGEGYISSKEVPTGVNIENTEYWQKFASKAEAEDAKKSAAESANAAKTSADAAKKSETNAGTSKESAFLSEKNAKTYADATKSNKDEVDRLVTGFDTKTDNAKKSIIAEGATQVGNVQAAAAEIVADRDQIQQNHNDIVDKLANVKLSILENGLLHIERTDEK